MKKKKAKKVYNISVDDDDLYWICQLAKSYIDSNESNFSQKLMVTRMLKKVATVGKYHAWCSTEDLKLIKDIANIQ